MTKEPEIRREERGKERRRVRLASIRDTHTHTRYLSVHVKVTKELLKLGHRARDLGRGREERRGEERGGGRRK